MIHFLTFTMSMTVTDFEFREVYRDMKDMKCRIWDTQNNRFWTDINEAYKGHIEQLLLSPSGDLHLRTMDGITHESVFPNRFIKSWYTGLKDNTNDEEWYEGDLLTPDPHSNRTELEVICYDSHQGKYKSVPISLYRSNAGNGGWTGFDIKCYQKRVGNRWDNPDLLGG